MLLGTAISGQSLCTHVHGAGGAPRQAQVQRQQGRVKTDASNLTRERGCYATFCIHTCGNLTTNTHRASRCPVWCTCPPYCLFPARPQASNLLSHHLPFFSRDPCLSSVAPLRSESSEDTTSCLTVFPLINLSLSSAASSFRLPASYKPSCSFSCSSSFPSTAYTLKP